MSQRQELFRAVVTMSGTTAFVDLFGELDFLATPELEKALASALSTKPCNILCDLSAATFICGQGYVAIGQCSRVVEHFMVRSKNDFPQKILRILGYQHIVFVTTEHSLARPEHRIVDALQRLEREAS